MEIKMNGAVQSGPIYDLDRWKPTINTGVGWSSPLIICRRHGQHGERGRTKDRAVERFQGEVEEIVKEILTSEYDHLFHSQQEKIM